LPPHGLFGLSWDEIAAIVAILTAVYAGLRLLLSNFKNTIMEPLSHQMQQLSDAINDLSKNSANEHKMFDKRLDSHDIKLTKHDTEIGTLYDEVGLKRRNRNEN
jgi:non-ribosomal peptide synthetase component F